MRVFSYVVTHNEADRYLREVLVDLMPQVDGVCVLDDRSTDKTVDVLKDLKIPYRLRPQRDPSFVEDESAFRESAWRLMEAEFEPQYGDWVVALDADEFLRTKIPLQEICMKARKNYEHALRVQIHEMWTPDQMRIDGSWGQINGLRLCEYRPNGKFKPEFDPENPGYVHPPMGGGSLPTYPKTISWTYEVDIVHYGYARDEDKRAKFERYSSKMGHSYRHINSILETPMLAPLPALV